MQSFDFVTFERQLETLSVNDLEKVQRLISLAQIKNGKDAFTRLKEWKDKNPEKQLIVCSSNKNNKCSMSIVIAEIGKELVRVTGKCKLTKNPHKFAVWQTKKYKKIREKEKSCLKKSLAKDVIEQLANSKNNFEL